MEGAPEPHEITARWTFHNQWDPEARISDLWHVLAYWHSSLTYVTLLTHLCEIASPIMGLCHTSIRNGLCVYTYRLARIYVSACTSIRVRLHDRSLIRHHPSIKKIVSLKTFRRFRKCSRFSDPSECFQQKFYFFCSKNINQSELNRGDDNYCWNMEKSFFSYSSRLPISHLRNSSTGIPPGPTTIDCPGWNLSRNTESPYSRSFRSFICNLLYIIYCILCDKDIQNSQIRQTKFSKVACKILKSIVSPLFSHYFTIKTPYCLPYMHRPHPNWTGAMTCAVIIKELSVFQFIFRHSSFVILFRKRGLFDDDLHTPISNLHDGNIAGELNGDGGFAVLTDGWTSLHANAYNLCRRINILFGR